MAEITGVVIEKLQEKSGFSEKSQKEWRSIDFLLEYGEPPYVKKGIFSVFGGDKIDSLFVGEKVKVHFNPEANQWQDKYFCKNSVWKIEVLEQSASNAPQAGNAPQTPPNAPSVADLPIEGGDDLPF